MKKISLILFAAIVSVICYFDWISRNRTAPPNTSASTPTATLTLKEISNRSSIVFILGEDKEAGNPYYKEALRYYTTNAEEKKDFVVSTCRSLSEVKDFLKRNSNGVPWGTIHLVSHGNQWTGLSVKVTPDSKRATTQRIVEHTKSDDFDILPDTVVDAKTEIFLHGCGVGNNRELIDAIGLFFCSKNAQPLVFAPRLFEYYTSSGVGEHLQSQKYMAETWFVSYPMGEKPSFESLGNELREKYAHAKVDWQTALIRQQPRWIGDLYHYTFEVPVKWIIPVDSVPDFEEARQKILWLNAQKQIVEELKLLELPIDKFQWTLTKGYAESENGSKKPAVFVKGYCTMLCVLKVLTEDPNIGISLKKPFIPALTDTQFYYRSSRTKLAGI